MAESLILKACSTDSGVALFFSSWFNCSQQLPGCLDDSICNTGAKTVILNLLPCFLQAMAAIVRQHPTMGIIHSVIDHKLEL